MANDNNEPEVETYCNSATSFSSTSPSPPALSPSLTVTPPKVKKHKHHSYSLTHSHSHSSSHKRSSSSLSEPTDLPAGSPPSSPLPQTSVSPTVPHFYIDHRRAGSALSGEVEVAESRKWNALSVLFSSKRFDNVFTQLVATEERDMPGTPRPTSTENVRHSPPESLAPSHKSKSCEPAPFLLKSAEPFLSPSPPVSVGFDTEPGIVRYSFAVVCSVRILLFSLT